MWVYCDTSAMATRYVRESGRVALRRALAGRQLVSSALMPVELHSAFYRRVREGSLATMALPRLLDRLSEDRQHWMLIQATKDVLREAELLMDAHALGTLDAVHVASACVFRRRMGVPLIFISADERQMVAAAREGLVIKSLM